MKGICGCHTKESYGKKQYYLIMDFNLSVYGEFRVTMPVYLKTIVSNFTETIQGIMATPEAEHLLTLREEINRKLLDEDRATAFHHSVEQLLFSIPCVRKDTHTTVEFFATRERIPNDDDWQK